MRRKGSTTGASVDPRERGLRKNQQEAKRGSTSKGRANIRAQVKAASGSSKRNQRQVEESGAVHVNAVQRGTCEKCLQQSSIMTRLNGK